MSSTSQVREGRLPIQGIKSFYARNVATTTMNYDRGSTIELVNGVKPGLLAGNESISQLFDKTAEFAGRGYVPEDQGKIKVGIVGAGVAGLFTALLFDWLNHHEDLKKIDFRIDYDIVEAAGAERVGGRLYTHHFTDEEHDYYDVGAMRFPNNHIMKRTFQLFNYIGITPETKPGLIPYYYKDDLRVCPSHFNDVSKFGDVWTANANDPYRINNTLPPNGKIHPDLLKIAPSKLVSKALEPIIKQIRDQFPDGVNPDLNRPMSQELWKLLIKGDHMSVRQYLGSGQEWEKITRQLAEQALGGTVQLPENRPFPLGPGYNFNTINWLETSTYGTGWYNQALTECVMEELDFYTNENDQDTQYWWCIDGGAQEIAKKMSSKINKRIQFNTRVESIDAQLKTRQQRGPNAYTPMKVRTTRTDPKTKKTETRDKEYFAIFNTTTLAAFQRIETCDAALSWGTKQAVRSLGYGPSAKVGIKFKSAWWQKSPFDITQGGLARTDLPIGVCVYPSYNIAANEGEKHDPNMSAVLLCSYTWAQDAQRIGSLCSNGGTPQDEEELKKVIFHDLARLHVKGNMTYTKMLKLLDEQYVEHHSWDWYRDQNMTGAFAYFGPGQFSNMWQEIIKPNSFGQLYLVGEASSSHHGWIVGALESVIRATYLMFEGLRSHDDCKAYRTVLELLSKENESDGDGPPLDNGAMPTGLPFCPLPDDMPTRGQDQQEFGLDMARLAFIDAWFAYVQDKKLL